MPAPLCRLGILAACLLKLVLYVLRCFDMSKWGIRSIGNSEKRRQHVAASCSTEGSMCQQFADCPSPFLRKTPSQSYTSCNNGSSMGLHPANCSTVSVGEALKYPIISTKQKLCEAMEPLRCQWIKISCFVYCSLFVSLLHKSFCRNQSLCPQWISSCCLVKFYFLI